MEEFLKNTAAFYQNVLNELKKQNPENLPSFKSEDARVEDFVDSDGVRRPGRFNYYIEKNTEKEPVFEPRSQIANGFEFVEKTVPGFTNPYKKGDVIKDIRTGKVDVQFMDENGKPFLMNSAEMLKAYQDLRNEYESLGDSAKLGKQRKKALSQQMYMLDNIHTDAFGTSIKELEENQENEAQRLAAEKQKAAEEQRKAEAQRTQAERLENVKKTLREKYGEQLKEFQKDYEREGDTPSLRSRVGYFLADVMKENGWTAPDRQFGLTFTQDGKKSSTFVPSTDRSATSFEDLRKGTFVGVLNPSTVIDGTQLVNEPNKPPAGNPTNTPPQPLKP